MLRGRNVKYGDSKSNLYQALLYDKSDNISAI